MKNINPTQTSAWQALQKHFEEMKDVTIADLFAKDGDRFSKFSATFDDQMLVDFSKNRITEETLAKLQDLAKETDLSGAIKSMFSGEKINRTEDRAVLHVALRNRSNTPIIVDGKDVMPEVNAVLEKMKSFSEAIISGSWKGYTGKAITDVVNIGIGGSDLGPFMVTEALRPYKNHLNMHFVSNVDGTHIAEVLKKVNPETTLFLVASKTFTTQETLTNAEAAKAWLAAALPAEGMARHFIGVTAAPDKATAFGCGRTFAFRDWVGGRYSLWSAVSLSCVIGLGWDAFHGFLDGAAALDRHFLEAPLERNGPVLMALADIYNVDGLNRPARSVAPYAHALRRLPAFLQQLEMESNGKRVRRDGSPVGRQTCPVVFGEPGSNGQHAFFQQLHQGPQVVPLDFVIVGRTCEDASSTPLWANALAQAQALMQGKTEGQARAELLASGASEAEADRLAPHKTFPGDRPSTAILVEALTPRSLGALIALYEHKTFVEGVLWDINSFDQWGVELGKALAKAVLKDVEAGAPSSGRDGLKSPQAFEVTHLGLIGKARKAQFD